MYSFMRIQNAKENGDNVLYIGIMLFVIIA